MSREPLPHHVTLTAPIPSRIPYSSQSAARSPTPPPGAVSEHASLCAGPRPLLCASSPAWKWASAQAGPGGGGGRERRPAVRHQDFSSEPVRTAGTAAFNFSILPNSQGTQRHLIQVGVIRAYASAAISELWAVGGDVSDIWSISPRGSGKLKISTVDLHGNHKSFCSRCSPDDGKNGEKDVCLLFRRGGCFYNLFSSGFVESEEYNPENLDLRFDVESVLNELKRGKRLVCNFCRKKGATVGCEERACRRSYHYFCALCDDAAIETDEVNGVYRVFCSKHDPGNRTNHYDAANKRKRHASKSSTTMEQMRAEETAEENRLRILRRKSSRHKVRIDFLRKCKQAGLLDDIFEEMLDTLHLAQEKLMDDNTSETEYEETVISLFDCGLFENILTNIHSGTEEKIQELLESRKRLDNQIELLQELKEVSLPSQESTASTSSTVSE